MSKEIYLLKYLSYKLRKIEDVDVDSYYKNIDDLIKVLKLPMNVDFCNQISDSYEILQNLFHYNKDYNEQGLDVYKRNDYQETQRTRIEYLTKIGLMNMQKLRMEQFVLLEEIILYVLKSMYNFNAEFEVDGELKMYTDFHDFFYENGPKVIVDNIPNYAMVIGRFFETLDDIRNNIKLLELTEIESPAPQVRNVGPQRRNARQIQQGGGITPVEILNDQQISPVIYRMKYQMTDEHLANALINLYTILIDDDEPAKKVILGKLRFMIKRVYFNTVELKEYQTIIEAIISSFDDTKFDKLLNALPMINVKDESQ
jgi:hypothetical protein